MRPAWRHGWDLSPREAIELQNEARRRVLLPAEAVLFVLPPLIAVADVGYDKASNRCGAALALWDTRRGRAVQTRVNVQPSTFPYVPGLLSFREIPPLLPLFAALRRRPGLILCDGQGYAHPRRFGLASHLGLVLGCPTLGWAKSRLIGEYREPGWEAGAATPLTDGGEQIGWALRSRAGCRPTFVSPGHLISMEAALAAARALLGRHRLCEPARLAHQLTRELLASRKR